MKMNKFIPVILGVIVILTLLSSYLMYVESGKRTALTVRDVTLYDTSVTSYKVKSNTVVNTKGYFLDKETNLKFTASIQDKLYREFQEGKSKPIDLQREFNLDTIEDTSDGPTLKFMAFVLILLLVWSAGTVIIINRQTKNKKETD
jgi:hypothetical protein